MLDILRRPHLMLTDIGNKDCVLIHHIADIPNQSAGMQPFAAIGNLFLLLLPFCDFSAPCRMLSLFEQGQQSFHKILDIAYDILIYGYVFIDLTGVDIYLNFYCFRRKFFNIQSNTIAESGSQCEHQICMEKCLIRCDTAVHSNHAEGSFIIIRHQTCRHHGMCRRNIRCFHQCMQLLFHLTRRSAAAAINNGTFCPVDCIRNLLQLCICCLGHFL